MKSVIRSLSLRFPDEAARCCYDDIPSFRGDRLHPEHGRPAHGAPLGAGEPDGDRGLCVPPPSVAAVGKAPGFLSAVTLGAGNKHNRKQKKEGKSTVLVVETILKRRIRLERLSSNEIQSGQLWLTWDWFLEEGRSRG